MLTFTSSVTSATTFQGTLLLKALKWLAPRLADNQLEEISQAVYVEQHERSFRVGDIGLSATNDVDTDWTVTT
ncbi:MAG: hypothetical protein NVSMB31_14470 [Vulcanimicrobiaceae bacterium]